MDRRHFKFLGFILIHIILPLIIGAFLYIYFRNDSIIFKRSINLELIKGDSKKIEIYHPKVADWIIYSLPDGLWVYSFSAVLYSIWGKNFSGIKIIIFIPFVVLCILETLQYFKIITGTFDFMDIFISFIMSILLIINFKLFKNAK